jgi:hypothetical protein
MGCRTKSRVFPASRSTYDNERSTHAVTEGAVGQGMNVRCKEVNDDAFLVAGLHPNRWRTNLLQKMSPSVST